MIFNIQSTDAFATGTIANTNLGSRMDKSFATGFQGQLIQISQKDRIEIDERELEAKTILLSQGIIEDFNGEPKGFPKTKLDFERDKNGNLVLQNGLPVKKAVASYYDIRHMIARNTFEAEREGLVDNVGNPILDPTTGKQKTKVKLDENGRPVVQTVVKIDKDLLEKTIFAANKLKELDITSVAAPKYRPGTTIIEALEIELKKNTNGIVTKALKKEGLTLSNFPRGTSSYEALKMVEDENRQGTADKKKAEDLVKDIAILREEEIFTIKRFKPFGGTTPTTAVDLLYSQPEKFRPTPAEEKFKPIWKNPPPLRVDLGKISAQDWKNSVVKNTKEVNPSYTEEEIIAKFGFDRIITLGAGWFGRS